MKIGEIWECIETFAMHKRVSEEKYATYMIFPQERVQITGMNDILCPDCVYFREVETPEDIYYTDRKQFLRCFERVYESR